MIEGQKLEWRNDNKSLAIIAEFHEQVRQAIDDRKKSQARAREYWRRRCTPR